MKTAKELALMAARALSDKKGREIQVLEIGDLTTLADYFVIATGSSNTQINALVDNVEKVLREEAQEEPLHREGYRAGTWVLLDYGNFVVHIQRDAEREFYGLDRLYADCPAIEVDGLEPYERPATFGNEAEMREAQNIEDLPLAGEGPAAADDEF